MFRVANMNYFINSCNRLIYGIGVYKNQLRLPKILLPGCNERLNRKIFETITKNYFDFKYKNTTNNNFLISSKPNISCSFLRCYRS